MIPTTDPKLRILKQKSIFITASTMVNYYFHSLFLVIVFSHLLHEFCSAFSTNRGLSIIKNKQNARTSTELAMFFAQEVPTEEYEPPSSVSIVMCDGDEASIQMVSDLMVDAFWLNSPQQRIQGGELVSADSRSKLVSVQHTDLMDKYGERLGKRVLSSSLILALDQDTKDILGAVCIDVCLLDKRSESIIPSDRSESILKNAVASLGPKQRRLYKDSSVEKIAADLLPTDIQAVCCLSNLVVGPKARRKGVAKKLCDEAERVASSTWAYGELFLKVEAENTAARSLYERKMGYSLKYFNPSTLSLRVNAVSGSFVEVQSDTLILSKTI